MMHRRSLLAGVAAVSAAPFAAAQEWPSRAVHIVVPFPPGGPADAVPRAIAQRMQLGVACVIENRPGASGTIGTGIVAKAPPDGYTFLSHVSSIVIQPHLGPTSYDVLADLVPVTQTVAGSYVLVVHPSFPASDLRGFIDVVRRAPGRYSYGSFGSGSGPHLAMELLKAETGLFIVHVPFRGAAPALQELVAGRLDMAFDTTFAALPHIRAGKLKAIAVGGARRVDALPDVPAVAETIPGFETDGWQGIFAPAGTPAPVVARIASEVAAALRDPELGRAIAQLGFRTVASSPADFAATVRGDHARWQRVIRERKIKPD
jgi:tripartite-type tricarboxylate transporter receptor subunit TctC